MRPPWERQSKSSLTFGYDAWIHECRQRKIGQHEKCDDALIGWHPWMYEYIILASTRGKTIKEINVRFADTRKIEFKRG